MNQAREQNANAVAKIELRDISKVFGPNPDKAFTRWQQHGNRDALRESGHALGLDRVSLSVNAGEVFVVMGLSGSGKSTLIRHINRLIEPTAGRVLIDGDDIIALDSKALRDFRQSRIAMVFQHFGLFPHKTVLDNVAYPLLVRKCDRKKRYESARNWLNTVGLEGFEAQYPDQLSGGQRQRVGLARALCADTDILLMDEAFSALDPLIRTKMQDELLALQQRLKKTVVFITHDLREALKLGDKIAILNAGQVAQVGTPEDILNHPADDYVKAFVEAMD